MSLNSKWLSHISDEVQSNLFKQHLIDNVALFSRLKEILEEKLNDSIKSRRSIKSYAVQAYGEYQADRNATERTILEIIDLIPTQDDKNG